MAELVDAHDSKSCGAIHESSILSRGTRREVSPSDISISPEISHNFVVQNTSFLEYKVPLSKGTF